MSSHSCEPFGDRPSDSPDDPRRSLDQNVDFDSVVEDFFVVEPTLRDANRHLRDLLGPCPLSGDGDWVWLDQDGHAVIHGGLNGIRRLADRCRTVAADDEDGIGGRPESDSRERTFWVNGRLGRADVDPASPHLPTGAQLRRRDSREV